MANTIGAKIVLDGEAEYRKAIKNINSEQKELRSEMKLATSKFAEQQNSMEALTKKGELLAKQYETQNKKVEVYAKAVSDSSEKEEKAAEKVSTLKAALKNATDEMDSMKSSTSQSSEAIEKQQQKIDDLKNKLLLAEEGYDKSKRTTDNWKTSLNEARIKLNEFEKEISINDEYIKEADKSYDNCAESIDEYGRQVDEAKDKTTVFADVLKAELVGDAIKTGIDELAKSIEKITSAAVTTGASFEYSMSQVAATMGITADEISNGSKEYDILKTAAEESGKATKYTASQSAEALNYLALAGYSASQSAETLPKVLNLAAAGGLDLAYASDLVTDAMAALGLETSDLDKYVDEMAKTSQKSNTSVSQLGEATLVCAGTVSLTKQSMETMNAELGVLANNGIKGAEGGTHLRNVLLNLVSPTDKGAEALAAFGIEVSDSQGNVRDLNDIMTDLNAALSNLSDSDRSDVISTIFNKTDIAAVNALLKGTGDEFDNLYAQISDCDGAAANMAETMELNLTGKITILQSALEGLGISAYDKIEGTLKKSVDSATDSVGRLQNSMDNGALGNAMDDFADGLDKVADNALDFGEKALPVMIEGLSWIMQNSELVISGIGGILTATVAHNKVIPVITQAMEAWKAYKSVNEGATISQWALNSAMNANPAGLLVTALAGVVSAFAIYKATVGEAKTATQEYADVVNEEIEYLRSGMTTREDNRKSHETEISTITSLKKELIALNEKEKLTVEEEQRMKLIVDELNSTMPDLNLAIDEETGLLSMTNDEIEKYIDGMQQKLEIGFMEEELTDIAKDHYEAKKQLTDIEEEYQELQKKSIELQEGWAKACDEGEQAMADYNAAVGQRAPEAIEEYEQAMRDLQPSLDEARKLEQDLQNEYDNTAGKLKDVEANMEEAQAAVDELTKHTVNYKDKTYEVSSEVAANIEVIQKRYYEVRDAAIESINSQVGLFEELNIKSDLSAQTMATNLKLQTEAFDIYSEDLNEAAELASKGLLDEGLLGALMELGIDGAGYLHELVNAAKTDTETFNDVMNEWAEMQESKEILIETLSDLQSDYSEQMDALLGIQSEKQESITLETETLTQDIQETVEDAFETLVSTTSDSLDDMNEAVSEKTPEIKETSQQLCTAIVDGANETLQITDDGISNTFISVGYSIPQGVAQGITQGQDLISSALQEAINHAINSIDLSGITAKINRELGDLY